MLFLSFCCFIFSKAQKKPLDHTVYDGWQSIGEKLISHDGKWVVYTINPQEGDNELVIRSPGTNYKKTIARGYHALITEDSRFLIFKIRPFFKDIREARIKKKLPAGRQGKADDFPKDSLAIVELGRDSVWKTAGVKAYKTPEKSFGWVAYHLDKQPEPAAKPGAASETKKADSLVRVIDSLQGIILSMKASPGRPDKKKRDISDEWVDGVADAEGDDAAAGPADTGTDLVLRDLKTGEGKIFNRVVDYSFSKNGQKLLLESVCDHKDSASKTVVLLYDLRKGVGDTLSRGGNEFRNFALSDDGSQVAYLAERDARPKELRKFYKLWYYKEGMDSAVLLVDKNTEGMQLGMTVSENGAVSFSKSGKRLFFGTAPVQLPKDTTLIDIDLVKVDIWHYNDDYLQTTQLNRLRRDQQENFLAVYHLDKSALQQLGSKEIPQVMPTSEGDGDLFVGVTDVGKRVESQWTGTTRKDIHVINVNDGSGKLIKNDLLGVITPAYISPQGKYIMWYDSKARNYFIWDGESAKNITAKIKAPLYNEEHDSPSDPPPYGIMGWHEGDSMVYIYDRYDVWKVHTATREPPSVFQSLNPKKKGDASLRYVRTDSAERFIKAGQELLFRAFNQSDKQSALYFVNNPVMNGVCFVPYSFGSIQKARDTSLYICTKENYLSSPDLVFFNGRERVEDGTGRVNYKETRLSAINRQQEEYNWGTAELFKWKAYNGKESAGIVYKPEDFDPKKKYPMICYFYETLSNGLYTYQAPAPTASRLNIPFFVSRGYIVFAPDIHYTTGHPGKDAYNHVVSGARALVKKGFVDSTRIGLQGQSWGGYQVAYLITATNLFKAAWAGAPVANMTSAYGGIRWESGMNRQFQYERTQSRIGATLWEKPNLYIENSPLFHLPKVKTPLVIMANDADGAVPWYQGIELFTGMRRLGKKVWMLNYNGEAHNLVERKNRKDIQVREQQFFDWLLKGEKPARWIAEGVPAVNKGRDWGLEIVE